MLCTSRVAARKMRITLTAAGTDGGENSSRISAPKSRSTTCTQTHELVSSIDREERGREREKFKSVTIRLFVTVSKAGTRITFHDFQFFPSFKEIVANLMPQQKDVLVSPHFPS